MRAFELSSPDSALMVLPRNLEFLRKKFESFVLMKERICCFTQPHKFLIFILLFGDGVQRFFLIGHQFNTTALSTDAAVFRISMAFG